MIESAEETAKLAVTETATVTGTAVATEMGVMIEPVALKRTAAVT